jgi:hypothetical protein
MEKITKIFNADGKIEYTEGEYYFPDYPVTDLELELDEKLGQLILKHTVKMDMVTKLCMLVVGVLKILIIYVILMKMSLLKL